MRLRPGESFDRYTIEALLGEGGMGEVYRALDTKLDRHIALKVLRRPPDGDPEAWERAVMGMLREARAAAALNHPNAIAVYDVGEVEGAPYLALELIEGTPLRRFVGGDTPLSSRLRWLCDVARALSAAHRAGLIHRDIKPENVMLREDGVIKVLDFGIARRLRLAAECAGHPATPTIATLSARNTLVGTPAYMAPEQVQGEDLDARADQFSWGVLAYELLSGRLPFGAGSDAIGAIADLLSRDPPPLEGVPAPVSAVVSRALSKEREDRFEGMDDIVAVISTLITGDVEVSPGDRRPAGSSVSASSGDAETLAAPRRRARWPIAAVAVALAASGALMAARRPPDEPAPVAAAPAAPTPAPTPITATEAPRTQSAEALAAYREGLQALRDAAWDVGQEHFTRATTLDPGFAAAHLRLAMTSWHLSGGQRAREAFQRAVQLRASLGERDQVLLDALAPKHVRDPPDDVEALRRLAAASQRFPGDAELLQLYAFVDIGAPPERQLEIAERCLELDPRYADCLQAKAQALNVLGRSGEGRIWIDRCLEVSPSALDCLGVRLWIENTEGQCARYEQGARDQLAKSPGSPDGYRRLATALHALGRPEVAVRAALKQAQLRDPEGKKERLVLIDEARIAASAGRFAEAERLALELDRKVALDPTAAAHQAPVALLLHLYEETGRDKEAGKVAAATLAAREAWTGEIRASILDDITPALHHATLRAGMISRREYEARRAAWLGEWTGRMPEDMLGAEWYAAYAVPARTAVEAAEALAEMPDPAAFARHIVMHPDRQAAVGKLYQLAGRPAEALPYLTRGSSDCSGLQEPFRIAVATYQLGEARAATGDTAGACAAFHAVVSRWGAAKESRTAKAAAERSKALGCAR